MCHLFKCFKFSVVATLQFHLCITLMLYHFVSSLDFFLHVPTFALSCFLLVFVVVVFLLFVFVYFVCCCFSVFLFSKTPQCPHAL